MTLPAVFGLSGHELTAGERAFFRSADPAGYILFGRNCRDPGQLRALTDELRALAGRALPILIDQEGGRVARLKPPHWPAFPAAAAFGRLYDRAPMSAIEAARANAQAMALVLSDAGVTMDCAPVLDLLHEGAHAVIGDRSFGGEPMKVAALGRAALDGLAAGGVAGIVKHIPGHGRARTDSHEELPRVEAGRDALQADFAPFRSLAAAPAAMVAHIVYEALDPERPASRSRAVIGATIRGDIGFDGLLFTDDIAMNALTGPPGARAAAALATGCDLVLHCSPVVAEMEEIAAAAGSLAEESRGRLERALALEAPAGDFAALAAKRDALLAYA